jgi:hypothetical protein
LGGVIPNGDEVSRGNEAAEFRGVLIDSAILRRGGADK